MIGRFTQKGVYRELMASRDFFRVACAGLLALAGYLWDLKVGESSAIGLALAWLAVALNAFPILWRAAVGLMHRAVNVDELVAIAITASLIQGEILTAAVVSFVMVLGSLVEEATSNSARHAIKQLIAYAPQNATIIRDDARIQVSVNEVKPDDVVLVRAGEKIPVDGQVVAGSAPVDESSMTGEPIPCEKKPGDEVYAGTMLHNGLLEIRATKTGADTILGRIITIVSNAEAHKPRAIRTVDRYARYFTPAIVSLAGLAWLFTGEIQRAITVLIVGCPCALILAAPTAVVAAIGRAARSGILVKGGIFLESIANASVALFDKTGTVTEGAPSVRSIATLEGYSDNDLIAAAASVELGSTHPFARAIIRAADQAGIKLVRGEDISTAVSLGVRGVVDGKTIEVGSAELNGGAEGLPVILRQEYERLSADGATPLAVYENHHAIGIIGVTDAIRNNANEAIQDLTRLGITRIGLVSGDHQLATKRAADLVGMPKSWSRMKPEDKLALIKKYQEESNTVIFIGDGINDAPALAAADVGIAMGVVGTDVALETADIALMNDDLSKLPFLFKLSRRMLTIIKVNLLFGLIFNAVAVVASGSGFLTPILGAVVHNIGSVLVVLASASLALIREPSRGENKLSESNAKDFVEAMHHSRQSVKL